MGVQGEKQRRSTMDKPYSGVGMSVNAPLVSLGQAEGALQVQVVEREMWGIPTGKEPGRERHHRPRHVLVDWVRTFAKGGGQRVESVPTLGAFTAFWIEGALDVAQPFHVSSDS